MKKISVVLFVLLFVTGALKAQHISLNAYGGYTFDDKSDFTNAYAHINGGFMWGLSVEGISESGGALELLYQHQQTDIPVHASAGDALLNLNNQAANISYLL